MDGKRKTNRGRTRRTSTRVGPATRRSYSTASMLMGGPAMARRGPSRLTTCVAGSLAASSRHMLAVVTLAMVRSELISTATCMAVASPTTNARRSSCCSSTETVSTWSASRVTGPAAGAAAAVGAVARGTEGGVTAPSGSTATVTGSVCIQSCADASGGESTSRTSACRNSSSVRHASMRTLGTCRRTAVSRSSEAKAPSAIRRSRSPLTSMLRTSWSCGRSVLSGRSTVARTCCSLTCSTSRSVVSSTRSRLYAWSLPSSTRTCSSLARWRGTSNTGVATSTCNSTTSWRAIDGTSGDSATHAAGVNGSCSGSCTCSSRSRTNAASYTPWSEPTCRRTPRRTWPSSRGTSSARMTQAGTARS
eukprot:Unigene14051_Nuclearia_a/m.42439 Unigene14051_Nuclearia_a/g.42439  ORF Unigene14051_Nuclearia_a/g.42439 Unigene14051_Nuclearia_a/m.42439 type:complete len:363 (+) Unigene14051_Nuclearia_a:3-1091(+)